MHAVPVKPSFVPKLNRADILVAMGLDLEISWLPALLEVGEQFENPCRASQAISIVRRASMCWTCREPLTARKEMSIPRAIRTTISIRSTAKSWRAISPMVWRAIFPSIRLSSRRTWPAIWRSWRKRLHDGRAWRRRLKGVKFVAYHQRLDLFRQSLRPAADRQHRAQTGHRTDAQSLGRACPKDAAGKGAGDHLRCRKAIAFRASSQAKPAPPWCDCNRSPADRRRPTAISNSSTTTSGVCSPP